MVLNFNISFTNSIKAYYQVLCILLLWVFNYLDYYCKLETNYVIIVTITI